MLIIIKYGIAQFWKNHDELADNPSKTGMSRRQDLKNSLLFSLFSGNPSLERVRK
jgi:hypothetical protein